jgi:CelD/BcsL family acetyltransferase involved in cellulose biosynthesis
VSGDILQADVLRPSALGGTELCLWLQMQAQSPPLQRAFLTARFALACEQANNRAHVAVLHNRGIIRGFFAFQFRSAWHQRLRIAERIGGDLCDAAGLVAAQDLRITGSQLLRAAHLSSLQIGHLVTGQEQLGLRADWSRLGYIADLSNGSEAYFTALFTRNRPLARDTERCLRKASKDYGELAYLPTDRITPAMISELISSKRAQYARTLVTDPFAHAANTRLLGVLRDMRTDECRLVLDRLQAGSRVLAQHLGLRYQGVLSYWFPVYDLAARSVSPGRLLLWNIIQSSGAAGTRIIDCGEGDAAYKREFATEPVRYGLANWYSGGLGAGLARIQQGLEWRLRSHSKRWQLRATFGAA